MLDCVYNGRNLMTREREGERELETRRFSHETVESGAIFDPSGLMTTVEQVEPAVHYSTLVLCSKVHMHHLLYSSTTTVQLYSLYKTMLSVLLNQNGFPRGLVILLS